ncbi:MAG TPA: hypothetical protein VJB59_13445 [Bdellovibrionota bacterium]|nr:hypothetical protein [Bdellovibrionota bacterium]
MTVSNGILDTVLLLALPASGKSEVRKYMAQLSARECGEDFHMGPTVQLDDFPYVHIMRCIDEELQKRGHERVYFQSSERPFLDPKDWGTLIALINEDHADLLAKRIHEPKSAAANLFQRLDTASKAVGAKPRLAGVPAAIKAAVADALEAECRKMLDEKNENSSTDLTGKTTVIEFARGGAHGSTLPLKAPFGYQYSLACLSDEILRKAKILYVWVTPEESRRKNQARANPNDPGSILHHGVPIEVMMNDYGCDDMEWLEKNSDKPGTVTIRTHGRTYHLPIARFDNRVDKTSFIRDDRSVWKPADVEAVHEGLKGALTRLASFRAQ